MVLLAGFQAVLGRWTGADDVTVGTPVAHRDRPGLDDAVAFLVDTLVLRTGLGPGGDGEPSFGDLLTRARETVVDAFAHRDAPFERVVEAVRPERDLGRTPLFEAFFAYQELPLPEPRIGAARLALEPVGSGATQFPLTLTVRPDEAGSGALDGAVTIDLDLFDRSTGRRFAGHLERLLTAALAEPDRPLAELDLLSLAERHQLVVELGRPRTEFPEAETLYTHFRRVAAERADAVALVDGPRALSYGELARRAAAVGAFLRARPGGGGPESVVAVLAGRSFDAVTAALGVHAAGGCYLPLDPGHPAERLTFTLENAGAEVVLVGGHGAGSLPPWRDGQAREVVPIAEAIARGSALGADPGPRAGEALPARPDSRAAYIIYTSGSTGRPKGVVVDQRGLSRLYDSVRDRIHYRPTDTRTQFHSPAFDFSVWETWSSLTHGGRLLLVPREATLSAEELLAFVERERVTVLGQTPSAFQVLQELEQATPEPRMPALRTLCLGGEALVPGAIAPWLERHGDRRPWILNLYGPTETVVMCTSRRIVKDDLRRPTASPIGAAVSDAALHVVDRDGRPVPFGAPGEIRVGGAALARGYVGRPGLTAERFVPDPFSEEPGARLYRTGDRARRRHDGDLEFLGRIDAQVKIRGYRVEPEEVESVLLEQPEVGAGAVVARPAPHGGHRLIAYVVARREAGAETVTEGALRSALGESLPAYMVPERFVFLDALPRTSSDKVDRKALPDPPSERPDLVAYEAPRSETEDRIAAIWCDLLGLERVGIYDNFFDLGGHSLLLGRAHRRLTEGARGRDPPGGALPPHHGRRPRRAPADEHGEAGGADRGPERGTGRAGGPGGRPPGAPEAAAQPARSTRSALEPSSGRRGRGGGVVTTTAGRAAASLSPREGGGGIEGEGGDPLDTANHIAIVGLGGRFPGAPTAEDLWPIVEAGEERIVELTDDELRASGLEETALADPRYVRRTGRLDGIELFDATLFGYSPGEAARISTRSNGSSWSTPGRRSRRRGGTSGGRVDRWIGVFAGTSTNGYFFYHFFSHPGADELPRRRHRLALLRQGLPRHPGRLPARPAGPGPDRPDRLLHVAGGGPPGLPEPAGRRVRHGPGRRRLGAAAPGRRLPPPAEGGILSPDGRCRSFDAEAAGTVFGERRRRGGAQALRRRGGGRRPDPAR